ncbi:UNVERIFIED_CONTAM: hypothetical protein K2H54_037991 [Gekko kuhli]
MSFHFWHKGLLRSTMGHGEEISSFSPPKWIKKQRGKELTNSMPEDIWIGLQFLVKTQESIWADGSEVRYNNFHPLIKGRVRRVLIDLFDEDVTNQCGVFLNNPNSSYIGAWNLTSCADTQAVAICQRKEDAVPAENQTEEMLNITTSFLNVKYIIILKNLTWYDALQECQLNNMQLVSITEQYQQAFLAAQAAQLNYPLWTGLSSRDDGIHYQWSDGKRVSLSYWSEEEDEDVDDCVYLDSDGFWKTTECDAEKPGAVCYSPGNANASVLSIKNENENNFVVQQLHLFSGLAHWVWLGLIFDENGPKENKSPLPKKQQYGNNTYWILQKKLNWYQAWKECKQNGSDLASIHSESQQLFLEDIVKHDGFSLWLGLSSHDMNESDFEWSDGSLFDYKPWEYETSQFPGNCVFLNVNGFWSHTKCTDVLEGAICYSPSKEIQSKQIEDFTTCPKTTSRSSQWILYNDYCYAFDVKFYNFSIYTAEEAEKVCQKLGMFQFCYLICYRTSIVSFRMFALMYPFDSELSLVITTLFDDDLKDV